MIRSGHVAGPDKVATDALALVVIRGPASGMIHRLEPSQPTVIGRSTRGTLRLADPATSREHVRLECLEGVWHISDLESRNGTFVRGERIQGATPLHPGDVISLGRTEIRLQPMLAEVVLHPVAQEIPLPQASELAQASPPALQAAASAAASAASSPAVASAEPQVSGGTAPTVHVVESVAQQWLEAVGSELVRKSNHEEGFEIA